MASNCEDKLISEIIELWDIYADVKKRIAIAGVQFGMMMPHLSEPLKQLLDNITNDFRAFVDRYDRESKDKLIHLNNQLEECNNQLEECD